MRGSRNSSAAEAADELAVVDANQREKPVRRLTGELGIILILLCCFLWTRRDTYLTPHVRGDQRFYVSAAMQLERDGIRGYTLRGIDIKKSDPFFVRFAPAAPGDKGFILRQLSESEKVDYYDMPILTTPPLMSYLIMFSHRILGPGEDYYVADMRWESGNAVYTGPQYARKQLYAVLVPLTASLLLVVLVYLLGRTLFGRGVATWAASLMIMCPTDILTAQRVWADDLTALLVVLAVFLFVHARGSGHTFLAALAGISAGLAATAKPSGGFIVFVICLYHLWMTRDRFSGGRSRESLGDRHVISFIVAGFLAALPWYWLVTDTYGAPWYRGNLALLDVNSPWFDSIRQRSPFLYLVNIPAQTPILALAYYVVVDLVRRVPGSRYRALLVLWPLVYLCLLWGTKEERYLLPAIPAVAILSGFYLQRIRAWIDRKTRHRVGTILVVLALILGALWSVPIARDIVLKDGSLIMFPL